jgi:putative RecB family exonuclease
VDFKTSARTPDPEMLAHTTETQTTSYGVLYREATGHHESGIELHHLIKTKTPKLVVTQFAPATEQQITRLFHVIEAYLTGLEREDFVPSPGLQCGSCEFFNECRAWQ